MKISGSESKNISVKIEVEMNIFMKMVLHNWNYLK